MLDSMFACQNQLDKNASVSLKSTKVDSASPKPKYLLQYDDSEVADINIASPKSNLTESLIAYRQMIADCVTRKVVIPLKKIDDPPSYCMNANDISTSPQRGDVDLDDVIESSIHEQESGGDFVCVISDVRGEALDIYDDEIDVEFSNENTDSNLSNEKCEVDKCCMNLLNTVETMTEDKDASSHQVVAESDVSDSELIIDIETTSDLNVENRKLWQQNKALQFQSKNANFDVKSPVNNEDDYTKIPKLVLKQNKDKTFSKSFQTNERLKSKKHGGKNAHDENFESCRAPSQNVIDKPKSVVPEIQQKKLLPEQTKSRKGKRRESDDAKSQLLGIAAKKKPRTENQQADNVFSDLRLQNELPGWNWLENKIKNGNMESRSRESPEFPQGYKSWHRPPSKRVASDCKEAPVHPENGQAKNSNIFDNIDHDVAAVVQNLVLTTVQMESKRLENSKSIIRNPATQICSSTTKRLKSHIQSAKEHRIAINDEHTNASKAPEQPAFVTTQEQLPAAKATEISKLNSEMSKTTVQGIERQKVERMNSNASRLPDLKTTTKRPTSSPSFASERLVPQSKFLSECRPMSAGEIYETNRRTPSVEVTKIVPGGGAVLRCYNGVSQTVSKVSIPQHHLNVQHCSTSRPPFQLPPFFSQMTSTTNKSAHQKPQAVNHQKPMPYDYPGYNSRNDKPLYPIENHRNDPNLIKLQEKIQRSIVEQNIAMKKSVSSVGDDYRPRSSVGDNYRPGSSLPSNSGPNDLFNWGDNLPKNYYVNESIRIPSVTSGPSVTSMQSPTNASNKSRISSNLGLLKTNADKFPTHRSWSSCEVVPNTFQPSMSLNSSMSPIIPKPSLYKQVKEPDSFDMSRMMSNSMDDVTILGEAKDVQSMLRNGESSQDKLEQELVKYKKELYLLEQMAKKRESEKRKLLTLHEKKLNIIESLEKKHRYMHNITSPPEPSPSASEPTDNSTLLKLLKAQKEMNSTNNFNFGKIVSTSNYPSGDMKMQYPIVFSQGQCTKTEPNFKNTQSNYSSAMSDYRNRNLIPTPVKYGQPSSIPTPEWNRPTTHLGQKSQQLYNVTNQFESNNEDLLFSQAKAQNNLMPQKHLPNFSNDVNQHPLRHQNDLQSHQNAFMNANRLAQGESNLIKQHRPSNLPGASTTTMSLRDISQYQPPISVSQPWTPVSHAPVARVNLPKFNQSNQSMMNFLPNASSQVQLQSNQPKQLNQGIVWNTTRGPVPNNVPQQEKPLRCKRCEKKAIFICSGCKSAWYCTPECQKLDWMNHFRICN